MRFEACIAAVLGKRVHKTYEKRVTDGTVCSEWYVHGCRGNIFDGRVRDMVSEAVRAGLYDIRDKGGT